MASDTQTAPQEHSSVQVAEIETGRLRMACRFSGNHDGIPVLLLHGSFATSRWWEPLAALAPAELRLIAPDLRGCGGTERPGTGYAIESQADDLAALVAALDLKRFVLVAHGHACANAIEFVLNNPEVVERLVLVSPPSLEGASTPAEALAALEAMRSDRALLERGLVLLAPVFAASHPQAFAALVADAAGMDAAAFAGNARALAQWNRQADARALTLPVLVIWGDRDPLVERSTVLRVLISLPGAENLDIMHGVGHSPMLDDPLGLAERLVDFVSGDDGEYASVRASAQ